jgi:hypothetical protein
MSQEVDISLKLGQFLIPPSNSTFKLLKGESIFTIGSCFARNIEIHLCKAGYVLPTLDFQVPLYERSNTEQQGTTNSVINKYTTSSILQEFQWLDKLMNGEDFESCTKNFFLEYDGLVIDGQMSGLIPVTYERALVRRLEWFEVCKKSLLSNTVVITLGLVETWLDTLTGKFIQGMPPGNLYRKVRGRFTKVVFNYSQCKEQIDEAVSILLKHNPIVNILLTVSPVPFGSTLTNEDVILANSYSKSTLRAVAGDIEKENKSVNYFPSYEIVVNNVNTAEVWEDDLIHVKGSFVERIVNHVNLYYGPEK